jgi:hypothetical protein
VQHTRVELHFHLLPDVDDGPKTLDEALALARLAVADGTGLVTCAPHVHLIDVSSVPERVATLAGALRPARIPLQVTPGGELRPGTRPTDARSLRSSRTARPIHVARSLCHLSCDRGRAGVRLLGSTSTYIRAVPHNRLSGNTANPFWAFWPTEVAPKRSRIWSARRG